MKRVAVFLGLAGIVVGGYSSNYAGWGPEQQVTHWGGRVYSSDAASSGDTIHVVFYDQWPDSAGLHEEVLYTRSTDAGNAWKPESVFTNQPVAVGSPRIAARGNVVHVLWSENRGQWDAFHRRSTDGGATWGPATRFSFNGDPGGGGDIVTDDGTGVYAFWRSSRGTHLRKSTDQGATWSRDTIITIYGPDNQPMHAAWSAGALVIAWQDQRYGPSEIFYKRSMDGGGTWSPDSMLSTRDVYQSQWPQIVADTAGYFYNSWMDYKYSPYTWTGDILMRVSRDSGTSWFPEDTVMFSHYAVASAVLPWREYLHVIYEDERDQPGSTDTELYGRVSTNQGVSFGPETRLTFSPPRSSGPVLIGTRNRVHLFWSESKVTDTLSELYHRWWEPGVGVEIGERPSGLGIPIYYLDVRPNPVSKECVLSFTPSSVSPAFLTIYDVMGRVVRRYKLKDRVHWDLKDEAGKEVKNGVYFIRIEGRRSVSAVGKVVVLRNR